jgi:primosomal protein N'
MKIISVIPLSRGISKETLTYFTAGEVSPGSIVKVPLRNKTVHALVVSIEDLAENKSDIKSMSFSIKKAESVVTPKFLSSQFIKAAEITAEYFAGTTGGILSMLVPKTVLDNAENLLPAQESPITEKFNKLVVQSDDAERFAHYKSIVREEFARKSSIFLCLPTVADVRRAKKELEKGIDDYTYVFHGQLKKKEVVELWNKLAKETHSVLIIATGNFFCVPRSDIGTIIVERECSRSYKSQTRPFVDIRTFAENFAKQIGARIVFGDTLLRTETIWRYKHDELMELSPLKFRSLSAAEQIVVDMRKAEDRESKFKLFSRELEALIKHTKENNERLFLFGSRRGLSPLTFCADCASVVECTRCKAPTTLHSGTKERYFLCHRCGEKRGAEEKCKTCTSWRLKTMGIGIELMAEELKRLFPQISLFRIDSDSTKTHTKALSTAKKFLETPGSILLGTEMALMYIDETIENSAVVSIDSMFSMPDFRVNEKILYILLKIRAIAEKKVIFQTRNTGAHIFDFAVKGNLIDFYKEEIEERQLFDYPPFTVLIKISLTGTKERVEQEMENLTHVFSDFSLQTYPAFSAFVKGKYTMHALIKIGRDRWIEKNLLEKLRLLPPQFSISVDPESIL